MSFGFEWSTFNKIIEQEEDNFLTYISPLEPAFFKGKKVIDVGCGNGRHTYFAAKYGAEVVATDVSEEVVQVAYSNTKDLPNVKVACEDIYSMPFGGVFDYVLCIGVLHHLVDSQEGFRKLVGLVKPGGALSIWVYGKEHNLMALYLYEPIKKITTKLPHKLLYYLCYIPAGIMELCNRFRSICPLGFIPFKYYARFPFRTKLNDAFDVFSNPLARYYDEEEIEGWFREAGLKEVRVETRVLDGVKKGIKGFGVK